MRRLTYYPLCMLLAMGLLTLGLVACKKDSTVKPPMKQVQDDAVTSKPATQENFTVDLGGGLKLEMVWIPGGTFQMGSSNGDDDEEPVHAVELAGFWMGETEVTQAQYEAIMGKNPSEFRGSNNPVETVNWNDATEFCRKLSTKTGWMFTLPTEAQWEYACRAGSRGIYCFGDSENQLGDYAWYKDNLSGKTHQVGGKKPNAWGLYDMHGNVWEWCQDGYGSRYSSEHQKNPISNGGSGRAVRGGSWMHNALACRSANRNGLTPLNALDAYGFRVSFGCSSR